MKERGRKDIIRYIEWFSNSRRRNTALNYRRPNDVHCSYQQPATAG
jgi:putative transposase